VRTPKRNARRGDKSTIDQRRIVVDSNEPAPRTFSYQRSDSRFSEQPRHQIAAAAREFVYDHRLWSEDRPDRRGETFTLASDPVVHQRPAHVIDDVISRAPASVESFINHRALFVDLREVVPIEIRVTFAAGVRLINISELASAELINFAAIVFDP